MLFLPTARFFSFFFSWSRHHRDLHSFPTRRSSDLQRTAELALTNERTRAIVDTALDGIVTMDHRSEEHTSELQSQSNLVCRLLLEKKKAITGELSPAPDGMKESVPFPVVARSHSTH